MKMCPERAKSSKLISRSADQKNIKLWWNRLLGGCSCRALWSWPAKVGERRVCVYSWEKPQVASQLGELIQVSFLSITQSFVFFLIWRADCLSTLERVKKVRAVRGQMTVPSIYIYCEIVKRIFNLFLFFSKRTGFQTGSKCSLLLQTP